jgi:hypothetical protein
MEWKKNKMHRRVFTTLNFSAIFVAFFELVDKVLGLFRAPEPPSHEKPPSLGVHAFSFLDAGGGGGSFADKSNL